MTNFKSLMFLDLFKGLFLKLGIDYPVMRRILQVKLTMDSRRVPTIFNQPNAKKKEGNQFLKSLGIYALFGLFLVIFIVMGDNYIYQMSITFGVIMFIVMTSMISDFSSVLLDVRDKTILSTKPVSKRTINAAKTLHICIYMTLLTGALTAIPLIAGLIRHGFVFFLVFFIELWLVGMFILVVTALIYITILRFFDGERLKDIINYVQILLSVGMLIGYQVLARSFEIVDLTVNFQYYWWHAFIPPIWYGSVFELVNGNVSTYSIIFSILAVIVPFISIIIYIRLIPTFERNLQKLMSHTEKGKKKESRIGRLWAKLLCRTQEERTFFRFASLLMKKERDFKLKVYPSLGFALVIPFVFLFNQLYMSTFAELRDSNSLFLVIYFCIIMIPTAILMLKYSGTYKGAWIYRVTPIKDTSVIYSGTLKAFLVKLFLPIYVILSIIFVSIFSFRIWEDLIIVLIVSCIYTVICFKVLNQTTLPFTQSFDAIQQSETGKIFMLMFIMGGFAIVHYISTIIPFGTYIYMVVLLVVNVFIWKKAFSSRNKSY
ncbi:hypothetical protein [Radiobacillus sp. PE A8.2]|uniref:hypothetical protein n=1 Tax=Radiobacillus sp. PE A8.2 TaxID=3380349 RepID=UPI003890351D